MPTIAVVGEVVADAVLPPDGIVDGAAHLTVHPGGGPANTAVALSRLGSTARFAGRLSGGALGALCRAKLEESQVDLSASETAVEPATLAIARLDAAGAASYEFYVDGTADWAWTDDSLAPLIDGPFPADAAPVAVHTGSLALALQPSGQVIERLLARARADDDRLDRPEPADPAGPGGHLPAVDRPLGARWPTSCGSPRTTSTSCGRAGRPSRRPCICTPAGCRWRSSAWAATAPSPRCGASRFGCRSPRPPWWTPSAPATPSTAACCTYLAENAEHRLALRRLLGRTDLLSGCDRLVHRPLTARFGGSLPRYLTAVSNRLPRRRATALTRMAPEPRLSHWADLLVDTPTERCTRTTVIDGRHPAAPRDLPCRMRRQHLRRTRVGTRCARMATIGWKLCR